MKRAQQMVLLGILGTASPRTSVADGKVPLDMGWAEARTYLQGKGFQVTQGLGDPNSLRTNVVDGVSYSFAYDEAGTSKPPTCIAIMGASTIAWRPILAMLTGQEESKLPKIAAGRTGKLKRGKQILPVMVEPMNAGAYIGKCD